MYDEEQPTPCLTDLQSLARRRWRVLLGHPPARSLVEATLQPVARKNSAIADALERWSDASRHASGGGAAASARFVVAGRSLAALMPRVDGFGRLAQALDEGIRARLGRAPCAADLAQVAAQEIARDDYLQLRNRLIDANFGLVHHALRQLDVRGGRYEDAVHDGVLGLVRALEGFDPERGTQFSTYAMYWVRTEIAKSLARRERGIRIPTNVLRNRRAYARSRGSLDRGQPASQLRELARQAAGLTERQLRAVESIPHPQVDRPNENVAQIEPDPLADIEHGRMRQRLWTGIPTLSARERLVVGHRFELEGRPFRTLAELGRDLGLSRERVRQIQAEALDKLREHLSRPTGDTRVEDDRAA